MENGTKRGGKSAPQRGVSVGSLLLAVAACAAIAWSIRSLRPGLPMRDLSRALRSGPREGRLEAVARLEGVDSGEIGLAVPALIAAMAGDADPDVRAGAARTLGRVAPRLDPQSRGDVALLRSAIAAVVVALGDESTDVRAAATGSLGDLASQAPPGDRPAATTRLLAMLGDRAVLVRMAAVWSLGKVSPMTDGPPPPRLVAAIRDDPEDAVRKGAIEAMAHFSAEAAIPIVLRASQGGDADMHQLCRNTMAKLRPSMATLPALTAALGGPDDETRALAVSTIGRLGPAAQSVVPALIATIDRPGEGRKFGHGWDAAAITALGRIAPGTPQAPRAVEALLSVVRTRPSRRSYDQITALQALTAFDPREVEPAVPPLIAGLRAQRDRPDRHFADILAATLGKIAPGTGHEREAVDALLEALDSPINGVSSSAASALGRFGAEAAPAVPKLRALAATDPSPHVRISAASAVQAITADDGPAGSARCAPGGMPSSSWARLRG